MQLPKTMFGKGSAEIYLVDTLNKLVNKKLTAKCMSMISSSRSWASTFEALMQSRYIKLQDTANLIRLFKEEQAKQHEALNKRLDEDIEAWSPELTAEGLELKKLEALALKLAMNVSRACMKEIGSRAASTRLEQLRLSKRLTAARRKLPLTDLSSLRLAPAQELKVLLALIRQKEEQTGITQS